MPLHNRLPRRERPAQPAALGLERTDPAAPSTRLSTSCVDPAGTLERRNATGDGGSRPADPSEGSAPPSTRCPQLPRRLALPAAESRVVRAGRRLTRLQAAPYRRSVERLLGAIACRLPSVADATSRIPSSLVPVLPFWSSCREQAHLPAEQSPSCPNPRLPAAHADPGGTSNSCRPARQGPGQAVRLSTAPSTIHAACSAPRAPARRYHHRPAFRCACPSDHCAGPLSTPCARDRRRPRCQPSAGRIRGRSSRGQCGDP